MLNRAPGPAPDVTRAAGVEQTRPWSSVGQRDAVRAWRQGSPSVGPRSSRRERLHPAALGQPPWTPDPEPEPEPQAPIGSAGLGAPGVPSTAPQPRRLRWHLALRERLPLWLQLRVGIEPRTLAALAVVLVLAGGLAAYHYWTGRPQTVRAPAAEPPQPHASAPGAIAPGPSPAASGAGGARRVVIDVAGKVRNPGIFRLPAGSRVADALDAAGGVRPGTDTRALNRARVLNDGEQIVVGGAPGVGGTGPGTSAAGPAGAPGSGGSGAGPVSLNSATAEQLDALPGVGPVLARHILEYREQNGGFTSVAQLREVNGIGDSRFADLQPLVQP
ncbi:ComEA family DNA-binding protein [Streptomyces sp. NPDC051776]|uniref:ComEA family DNA-binding protein n=1 Tax=Streptomyces sp. NPDC051776 TaxID=3155414 RepID=UPI0034401BEF